jgi:hypothetical protein
MDFIRKKQFIIGHTIEGKGEDQEPYKIAKPGREPH